jgi:TrmH RNA methyltransferase
MIIDTIEGIMSKKINQELRIYGENACLAIFKNRPEDIIQLFYTKQKLLESSKLIKEMTAYLAKHKKAFHLVGREEISKITKATHHEDISMLIKKKKEVDFSTFLKNAKDRTLLLALMDVENPHNLGAIIRTAAHFGVSAILTSSKKMAETGSAIRVSEGGFEFVHVFEVEDFKKTLENLTKEKFQIVGTSSHAKMTLEKFKWNKKSVILFGSEEKGLPKEMMSKFECIKIDGTDRVESLNVSVASSVLMYDFFQKVK